MRIPLAPLALAMAAASCDRSEGATGTTALEERHREFIRAMKAIDLQYENLHGDLLAAKPAEAVRRRVASIRATAEQASTLAIRASEAENRDLSFEFRKFLDASARLEKASWTGDDGVRTWKHLGQACASCHDLYREDEHR